MYKLRCRVLLFFLVLGCCSVLLNSTKCFAISTAIETTQNSEYLEFDEMSIEELNQFIDCVKKEEISYPTELNRIKVNNASNYNDGPIEQAWKAAAAIARKKGYPCAAQLVECSVDNIPYKENSVMAQGMFAKKIVKTSAYKPFMKKARKKEGMYSSSFAITKSMNSDLFYALHNVNAKETHTGPNNYRIYHISITDTFDFAYDNNYNELFTSCVNNWAWLCQQTRVLHKIKVEINFTE